MVPLIKQNMQLMIYIFDKLDKDAHFTD